MTLTPGVPEALEVRIREIIGNAETGDYPDIMMVTLTQRALARLRRPRHLAREWQTIAARASARGEESPNTTRQHAA